MGERSERRPRDLEPGTRIGRYLVHEVVGRGGMGTVYRAFDAETQRDVAIKLMDPGLSTTLRQRFGSECEAEARIRHPNVMPVYDQGVFEDDRPWFTMELVYEPITLTQVVEAAQQGRLGATWPRLRHWAAPARLVQDVLVPVARGIDAANREYGILHRDLKPDNVLIDVRTRRAYLIDFGICHRAGEAEEPGRVIGTPRFLSPEQSAGRTDRRTDVWGVGGLLFYVLSGRSPIRPSSPFRREERAQRIHALAQAEAQAEADGRTEDAHAYAGRRRELEAPDHRVVEDMIADARAATYDDLPETVPAAARAIVRRAMARAPADRYDHVGALADDLERWVTGNRVEALAEAGTGGAAVWIARRALRRHLANAAFALVGLAVAVPFGARLLAGPDPAEAAREADAEEDVAAMAAALDRLAEAPADAIPSAIRWRGLARERDLLAARVDRLPAGPRRTALEQAVAALGRRLGPTTLRLGGFAGAGWKVEGLLDGATATAGDGDAGAPRLAPGPYRLVAPERRGIELPFAVPVTLDAARNHVIELRVPVRAEDVPDGMVYVPATEEGARPFLLGIEEVTNLAWGEWLDELPDEERAARVPPRGFRPDPARPGRFLVDPDLEAQAVLGVRLEDVEAYAAWRGELWGATYRPPTPEEWRRAAGEGLLARDPAWAARSEGDEGGEGMRTGDRGPYGTRGLLARPAELVRDAEGWAVVGETEGLALPWTAESLARVRRVEDAPPAAGFRLVRELPE